MSAAKERFCCYCGDSLGMIEAKHYDRNDTCGKRECNRAMNDMAQEEREDAHEQLDRDMGWLIAAFVSAPHCYGRCPYQVIPQTP